MISQQKLTIDNDVHRQLKAYCKRNSLTMKAVVERLIRVEIGEVLKAKAIRAIRATVPEPEDTDPMSRPPFWKTPSSGPK